MISLIPWSIVRAGIIALGLVFAWPFLIRAQQGWQTELSAKLGPEANPDYLHLIGYFDNKIYVDMYLASDPYEWVGFLLFSGGQLRFELEGGWVGDQLILLEYDVEGSQTGSWKIQLQREQYHGWWTNPDGSMDFNLVMYNEVWNPDFRKEWYNQYDYFSGKQDMGKWFVEMQQNQTDILDIRIFESTTEQYLNVDWNCQNANCSQLALRVNDPRKRGVITEFEAGLSHQYLDLQKKAMPATAVQLDRKGSYHTLLHTFMDDQVWLSLECPQSQDPAFQLMIGGMADRLFDSLQLVLQDRISGDEEKSLRWKYFIQAWFEVHYWDDSYLSGRWVVQNSWEERTQSYLVNFSIKNGRIMTFTDQFRTDFDWDFFLLHYVQDEVKKLPAYKDPVLRPMLQKAEFRHLGISREGLLLSSDFNTLYGTFELIIPFREIENYIKKRSELARFVQNLRNG